MKIQDALDRAKDQRDGSYRFRQHCLGWWALAFCYAYGRQWGHLSSQSAGWILKQLRYVTDPGRVDVRFHLNKIRPAIEWLVASLDPQRLQVGLRPWAGGVQGLNIKYAGEALFERHLDEIRALPIYRLANRMRFVMGTGIIKRTLRTVRSRRVGEAGVEIRDMQAGWAAVYPHEIIRDPTANSTEPAWDEECYGHEKPRTVGWIQANYGKKIETDTRMATLLEHRRTLHASGGFSMVDHSVDSRQKGVMYYEFYFKDAPAGPGWPWMLPCLVNFSRDKGELIPLVGDAKNDRSGRWEGDVPPNPHDPRSKGKRLAYRSEKIAAMGLPFHHLVCERQLQSAWGPGVPHLLMAGQDMTNYVHTWVMRLVAQGGGKTIVDGSTIENPRKAFNNRLDEVILWRRQRPDSQFPQRLEGPKLPPAMIEMLKNSSDWMEESLMRSPVQMGETSPRGESGQAIELKLQAAGLPMENRRKDDELTLAPLLLGTYFDLANPDWLRLDQIRERVGPDVPEEYIRALLREHPALTIRGVDLQPSTLRPRTPGETREDFVALGTAGILTMEEVQHELFEHGQEINTLLAGNIRKQILEIDAIIAGEAQDVSPAMDDEHRTHRYVIKKVVGSPQWHALSDEIRQAIEEHSALHLQAEMELAGAEAQLLAASQSPPRPSPPGEAVAAATGGRGTIQNPGAVPPVVK